MTSLHFCYVFYADILLNGFDAAIDGYTLACVMKTWKNKKEKEEFRNDCEIFSKTAKAIDDLLKTTMEEQKGWLELQDEFEKVLKKN